MFENQAKNDKDASELPRPASQFTLFKLKPAYLINSSELVNIDPPSQAQGHKIREPSHKKKKKTLKKKSIVEKPSDLKLPKLQFKYQIERQLIKNHDERTSKSQHHKRQISDYLQECKNRDKQKHPLKYKVVAEQAGIKDEKIYKLKQGDISQIQKSYLKQIGLQYLHEGNSYIRRCHSLKAANLKSYIHQIFNPDCSWEKGKGLTNSTQRLLKDCEQMQGHIVYKRVQEHLKGERSKPNYFYRVKTQANVDSALIDFMKLKIVRAQTRLKQ